MDKPLKQNNDIGVLNDLRQIIEQGRRQAYAATNTVMIKTYWKIGQRIVEEEQQGSERANYGTQLLKELSNVLTREYGVGFGERSLRHYRQFYLYFSDLEIWNARVPNLTWTHFRRLLTVENPQAREWYMIEASEQMWSTRTLDRNISTQYFERRLAAQREASELPQPELIAPESLEYIKNPVVAEFLGFRKDSHLDESQLEQALINNLQQFIMELGKGFAFVDRQKHMYAGGDDYYIDLVFYNINLHCYVLIDLKTHRLTHQDIGQMDMYVRMYDDLIKLKDDNPTIGILLCSETNEDIARYSILHDNNQLFASKYMLYMPTKEELRHEIERQKAVFQLQQEQSNE